MMGTSAPALQTHYDAMWARAFDAVAAGAIDIDPQLTEGPDPRRGLTLIARPGPALAARFDHLLDVLTDAEPDQYRCAAADMHVTMLSLITVAGHPSPELARLDDYHAAVDAALAGIGPFAIDFTGISVSRAAVVAQGFPRDATLATLRVDDVELVVNDWYMSSGSLRRVMRRALIERVADCD